LRSFSSLSWDVMSSLAVLKLSDAEMKKVCSSLRATPTPESVDPPALKVALLPRRLVPTLQLPH
jgi:hypothetical protein